MKNLTDFYKKNKDGALFFINFATDKTLKIAGYGILKVLLLIFFMGIFVSANAQFYKRFDLAFGDVNPTESCESKKMDVNIVNVNSDTSNGKADTTRFTVNNLYISIKYLGNVTIDEAQTTDELNDALKSHYQGFNNDPIVTYPDHEIRIRAYRNSDQERQEFHEIFDLITIYFTGEPDEQVDFYFEYNNPKSYVNLFDWDNTLDIYHCIPKQGGNGYNITQSYTFSATSDYDLGFLGVTEPDPDNDCDFALLDMGVVNYSFDASSWQVEKFQFYIGYDNTNIDIADDATKESINSEIRTKYEGISDPGNIVTFTPGRIAIEGKLKEGYSPMSLLKFNHLITVFFKGTPAETVHFSFSYDSPQSWCLLNDGTDCYNSTPKQISNSPLYSIVEDYTFSDELKFVGIVSNMSDGTEQGRCGDENENGGEIVSLQKGVTMNFYKNNVLESSPLTKGKDDVDCAGESLYGKAVCKMDQPVSLVRVEPEIEMCKLNGVTTLDIVLIQKHLLGIKPFQLTYQYYAADVDDGGKVTVSDILVMRKAILGIDIEPDELNFDFIPEAIFELDQSNCCPTDNFYGNCPQFIEFPINNNPDNFDFPLTAKFYGFKDGDVNNSCNNCNHNACGGSERDNGTHDISIDNVEEKGDTIEVTVKTGGKDSVEIIGVTLDIDPKGIELDTLLTTDAVDTVPIYNYNRETGILKIIWENKNAYNGVSSTTDNIFKLKFKKGLYSAADLNIKISNSVGPHYTVKSGLAYTTEFDQNLKSRSIIKQTNNLNRFEITPTIFKDRLILNYTSDVVAKADFTLYNNIGQIVYNKKLTVNKGDNDFELRGFENIQNGIVYYKLKCGNKQYTGKLIK